MSWFDWLRKTPAPLIDLPLFGRVRASHRPSSAPWLWEMLDWIETPRGRVSATFDAGAGGPGSVHERDWRWICDNIDDLTAAASRQIAADLANWLDQPFSADAWSELGWEGVHLTGNADQFELRYSCKSWPDALITVYFERGRPALVQIDD